MRVENPSAERCAQLFAFLDAQALRAGEPIIKYLALGTRTIRLLIHSAAFLPHIERHLAWSLKDDAAEYCATLIVWQGDIGDIALTLFKPGNFDKYRELRAKKLMGKAPVLPRIQFFDEERLRHGFLADINPVNGSLSAWDFRDNTYYYALNSLDSEELAKRGRLFSRALYAIAQSPSSNLAHGAVVGLRDTGVLFCGSGYRGKSTLTVSALLDGFDYVADDYFVLEKQDDVLRAWPIYSRVAISPEMYTARYATFNGKFLGNNVRYDKYLFNIEAYHGQFRSGYPIKLCMYLRIADCAEPHIVPGDKEIAVEEFALSTSMHTGKATDVMTIAKLHGFIEHFPFYRFNLSRNIDKNTRCLREFLEHFATHGE